MAQPKVRNRSEELLAELAAAGYRVAQQHDFQGAFIDVELDLWDALRARLGGLPLEPGGRGNAEPKGER
jgi:hypothetical protein